jgi:acetyl-CoA carboxylase carboxyltransferase component
MAKTPLKRDKNVLNRWAEIVRSRFHRDSAKTGTPARVNTRGNAESAGQPAKTEETPSGRITGVHSIVEFVKQRAAKLPRLTELEERKRRLMMGGGKKAIAAQHEKGKLTARERLNLLLDSGSFEEINLFVTRRIEDFGLDGKETPADGVVTGSGTIDGQLVYVSSEDFTVLGGSLGEMHANKICHVLELALRNGVPFIQLNDSGGARVQEGVAALNGYGKMFRLNTRASGVIPQISVVLGPCAGGAVYSPAITDFVIMVDRISHMFITGPNVIKTVTGEEVNVEELGGARVHNQLSGVAHFMVGSEEECMKLIATLLSYLPRNNLEPLPERLPQHENLTEDPALDKLVPQNPAETYDVHGVLKRVFDDGEFLEVQAQYARNIVVGFARLMGITVGVLANQPKFLAGCLDINSADKAARFIRCCDAFNIPLINLVDVPGFLPGVAQEHGGVIRHGAKMLYAYAEATVPKIALIMRKAYGGAYVAMCSKDLGYDRIMAWPGSEIAVMGPEGAAEIIFKREIEAANEPAAEREHRTSEFREKFASPYAAAKLGLVDAVFQPRETRLRLLRAVEMLRGKGKVGVKSKHGNIPL